ncbi:MAG: beta-1,6-N-acetylglucosaminyltransferase [Lachnospiraceae bacterium]|nr:beta-1,6-N-acetylglucosaminyltransferase [Lachnospiraceae bacterium]
MKIAFLNLCHTDPKIVARVADKLTKNTDFDMYIHVDLKSDIEPFQELLKDNKQVYFTKQRQKVYWGGYHAILATYILLEEALASPRKYDYVVLLQNLDYPIKSNEYIQDFFEKNKGTEYIRGCHIAKTKDWHYAEKYKIYNTRDKDFYLNNHSKFVKLLWDGMNAIKSISTIGFNGVHKENGENIELYYGTAQWAVTRECAEYMVEFKNSHPKFNKRMQHIKFPDEEYFHTIVHNSRFKEHCVKYDEPVKRWLVNWRNIHYFEFPNTGVVVFTEKDFDKLMSREELFCRKVKSGISDQLLEKIDKQTE